ncbi:hypothetical protein NXS19_012518 [Fusarium pseudograminearum]|nr:hypothetical protein NXS19_012518 [Fusarium pseudograminearum]
MGVLPSIDSRPRLVFPHTPPELESPGASSYCTNSNSSADRPWISPAPTSPSMNNYDKSLTTDMPEDQKMSAEQTRPKSATQTAPRQQQLPSLSSIFGPPATGRPAHSPLSEHNNNSYSTSTPESVPMHHLVTGTIRHLTFLRHCRLLYHNLEAHTTTSSKQTDSQFMLCLDLTLAQHRPGIVMESILAVSQLLKGSLADGQCNRRTGLSTPWDREMDLSDHPRISFDSSSPTARNVWFPLTAANGHLKDL